MKENNDLDKTIIKNLKLYAYHGVLPEEKELGQFFLLDLVIYTSFDKSVANDSIENAINYAKVIEYVKIKFIEKKFNLIESAANFLSVSLLEKFQKIDKITITLKKPNAPINAEFNYVAVEITKYRL